MDNNKRYTVRRVSETEKERSTCGWRQRLFTTGDDTPLFAHLVKIQDSKAHYHKRATEFYYVMEGEGVMMVDGESFDIGPGTIVKLDPLSVHSSKGDLLVLVIGVPDILEDDIFFPQNESC